MQENNTNNRLWFVHVARSIACMLVVYKHIFDNFWVSNIISTKKHHFEIENFNYTGLSYYKIVKFIDSIFSAGAFGVALFFLVSGFVIPLSIKNKKLSQFVISRIFRIWPIYVLSLIFTVLMMSCYKHFFNHDINYNFTLENILSNFIPFQRLLGEKYLIGVYWTLEVEVKFYFIMILLWWIFKDLSKSRYILSISLVLFLMSLMRFIELDSKTNSILVKFLSENIIHCNPFYLIYMNIGICFYNHYEKNWSTLKTLINILVLLIICLSTSYYYHHLEWKTLRVSAYVQALMFFSTLYLFKYKIPYNKIIDLMGNISYPLYLIHSQNGYIIMSVLYYYSSSMLVSLVITIFILLNFAYLLHINIELPLQNYGKRLHFDRRNSTFLTKIIWSKK